jgi:site-specific DNA recombinase
METYSDFEVIDEAVREARDRSEADRPQHAQQLEVVEGEIRKTEEATERYFRAFEAGSISEAQCAPRLQALSEKMIELRCRKADLQQPMDREQLPQPTGDDLVSIRDKV